MKAGLSDDELAKGIFELWNSRFEGAQTKSASPFDDSQLFDLQRDERKVPFALDGLCPLLADLDRLLTYLDTQQKHPHDAIYPCPACGALHRWTLLSVLLNRVLDRAYRPVAPGSILEALSRMEVKPLGGLLLDP